MNADFILQSIVGDLELNAVSVSNTVAMLSEGATIPFIARYRKERTNGLNEIQIRDISSKLDYYLELEKRKETIIKTIKEQKKLTADLEKKINECKEKSKLEDLYLPYKPKKVTKATVAKNKGLQPLADIILKQDVVKGDKLEIIKPYVNPSKGVKSADDAVAGAIDIIAEYISDSAEIRGEIREYMRSYCMVVSKVRKAFENKKTKYEMYYDYSELLSSMPSHRVMAIRRGAREEVLSWKIEVDED